MNGIGVGIQFVTAGSFPRSRFAAIRDNSCFHELLCSVALPPPTVSVMDIEEEVLTLVLL